MKKQNQKQKLLTHYVTYKKVSDFMDQLIEINVLASPHDGRHTMHYCLIFFLFSWLTLNIATLVWWHRISGRIGQELRRRNLQYSFGASDFWLWNILGSLIVIGPFVYIHKLMKAMNFINADWNSGNK